jgi:hypothetical protein
MIWNRLARTVPKPGFLHSPLPIDTWLDVAQHVGFANTPAKRLDPPAIEIPHDRPPRQ